MRILAVLLLVCFLMPCTPAQAEDIFIKPHKTPTQYQNSNKKQTTPLIDLKPTKREMQTTGKQDAPTSAPAPKKVEEPPSPQGQTAVNKEMAQKYYDNCIAQENDTMTKESQELLCSCTSVKMSEEMSVEEIQTMFEDTEAGLRMRNMMLIHVYTPCMKFPTRDLVYKSCAEDRAVSENLKKPREVCDCMADKMADYTVEKAPKLITDALRRNPGDLDPLALLFDDVHFNAHSKGVMTQCLYTHEYGWKN